MTPHNMATTKTRTADEEEEELLECEVLWPEARQHHDHAPASGFGSSPAPPSGAVPAAPGVSSDLNRPCSASSRPVDIPRAARLPHGGQEEEEEEEEGDGAMVPPHVMVSRRRSEGEGETAAVAFSLRSGTGGAHRDLSHLRNSVLRMTGFIEG